MKKYAFGFLSAAALIVCVAATHEHEGVFYKLPYGGEPVIGADSPQQSAPWLDFRSNGVAIFQLPSTGIISTANGGTGVSVVGEILTNASFPAPIAGSSILVTSNYDLWIVTPTKTNRIVQGS